MSTDGPLYTWTARELASAVAARDVSAAEVMRAHLDRIEEVEAQVAAFVSLLPEPVAMAMADEADAAVARGDELGALHGLPTGVKDLMDVAGLPTSQGSAAYADAPPAPRDSVLAEHLRRAGALIIGKTNTPEIGLGTLTFNPVRGVCRNPWDLRRHAGGSSGGAGAALAAGMLPIADGSDSGGSIRYPASFCNVVGLRPTPGMVPSGRVGNGWDPHGVAGPMARDSRDAALMLAGIAGHDPRWPLSWVDEPGALAALEDLPLSGLRFGWSPDVGGLPIDPAVRAVLADARRRLEAAGATVLDIEPDLDGADEAWRIVEMFGFAADGRPRLAEGRTGFRADYLRNVEEGLALSAADVMDGFAARTEIFRRTAAVLRQVDAIIYPATPVAAPPAEVEWVAEIDGARFDRYFLWQRAACRLTVTGHPVLATPAGFTGGGLPVGMQIVGPSRGDRRLLAIGAAVEDALGLVGRMPTVVGRAAEW
ncbi:amidase [Microbacterium sp. SORGH_AS_0888]|uniref:amidase n=1 Tax=Microbacterium sp. SORGH_AS_0888 TaxID=3041791 RepID=UPI00278215AF|nr:amidase family protein [Microbacterium sp. SORGH_AS_0888]MDQ1129298.1 amidase [Microbacterium sp. SORGH_AS_0888]